MFEIGSCGIHFGYSYASVAIYEAAGPRTVVTLDGDLQLPTAIKMDESGAVVVGSEAKYRQSSGSSAHSVKHLLGVNYDKLPANLTAELRSVLHADERGKPVIRLSVDTDAGEKTKEYSAAEACSLILRQLKQNVEEYTGKSIPACVITVPAEFNDSQRQMMKDAGVIAGFNVRRIINEPTAACIANQLDKTHKEVNGVVVRFGASSFSITVMTIDEGVFEVKSTAEAFLGLNSIDELLIQHLLAEAVSKQCGSNVNTNSRALLRLKFACERLRETLSRSVESTIDIDALHEDKDFVAKISRAKYEELARPVFNQITDRLELALQAAKLQPADISFLVFSGGGGHVPKLQDIIQAALPRAQIAKDVQPIDAVAHGAAIQAYILGGNYVYQQQTTFVPIANTYVSGAGLYAGATALPLIASKIDVQLVDFTAKVTVKQSFQNTGDKPVEAVYIYPVEPGSAVCSFSAEVDGRLIVGKSKPKQQAKEEYDDAIAQGHGAYMLEELTGEVFQITIGNLPPTVKATINIVYVSLITSISASQLRFSLPTISGSQHIGGITDYDKSLVSTTSGITQLTINCQQGSVVTAASPSHAAQVKVSNQGTIATVEGEVRLSKDFVLLLELAEHHQPGLWVEAQSSEDALHTFSGPSPSSTVVMASFYPTFQEELGAVSPLPCEIIFVIDRSGSMSGGCIKRAKEAMLLFIKSLPSENILFNIVGFGSHFTCLFDESQAYNQETLTIATNHIHTIDADMGGTEILEPLKAIFAKPPKDDIPRQIIFITDGEVSNTMQVIQFVAKQCLTTRIFTMGIGDTASKLLVSGMASASNGAAEFLTSMERMEGKVVRQLRRALTSFMTRVEVDWGELPVTAIAPKRFGHLFSGDRVIAYAFLHSNAYIPADATAVFKAISGSGPIQVAAKLVSDAVLGDQIHVLAAKTLIKELEDAQDSGRSRDPAAVNEQIENIALAFNLASRMTSFVAVEERDTATENSMVRAVPEMTSGYGGQTPTQVKSVQTLVPVPGNRVADLLLIDVIPLTLGVNIGDNLSRPVLPRNTTIPTRRAVDVVVPVTASGTVNIHVMEGERPVASQNNELGLLVLSGLSGESTNVNINFDLDANGILHASVIEKTSGQSNSITITNDQGRLSRQDIERMVCEAEKFKSEDDAVRQIVCSLHAIERYIFDVQHSLTVSGLPENDKQPLLSILEHEGFEWLKTIPGQQKTSSELADQLKKLKNMLDPELRRLNVAITGDPTYPPTESHSFKVQTSREPGALEKLIRQNIATIGAMHEQLGEQQDFDTAIVRSLLEAQHFNGSWDLAAVLSILQVQDMGFRALNTVIAQLSTHEERLKYASIWGTLLAMSILQSIPEKAQELAFIVDKGRRYANSLLAEVDAKPLTADTADVFDSWQSSASAIVLSEMALVRAEYQNRLYGQQSVVVELKRLQRQLQELSQSSSFRSVCTSAISVEFQPWSSYRYPSSYGPRVEEVD